MDPEKNKLAHFSQKKKSWLANYEIVIGGVHFGDVIGKDNGFNFKEKLILKTNEFGNCQVSRSLWHNEYRFIRKGKIVALAIKTNWNWKAAYTVEIFDSKNHLAILGTCIVIDQVLNDIGR
jgi:uncharacterized protein YxjI